MKNEQLTLVAFKAPWCRPCKVMDPIVKNVLNIFNNIQLVEVNVDEDPDITREYCVRTIPTFILKKGDKIIQKLVGSASSEQVKEFLSKQE